MGEFSILFWLMPLLPFENVCFTFFSRFIDGKLRYDKVLIPD